VDRAKLLNSFSRRFRTRLPVRGNLAAPPILATSRQRSVADHLLLLLVLVLPGLAIAQQQCTLYQALQNAQWKNGPGPVEPSLTAAQSDAQSISMADVPRQLGITGAVPYGFAFACYGSPLPNDCWLTYGAANQYQTDLPPVRWTPYSKHTRSPLWRSPRPRRDIRVSSGKSW
jgi:hypothetical protein